MLETLGLDDGNVTGKENTYKQRPVVKDANGKQIMGAFSYSSVVGMLLYLAEHT